MRKNVVKVLLEEGRGPQGFTIGIQGGGPQGYTIDIQGGGPQGGKIGIQGGYFQVERVQDL